MRSRVYRSSPWRSSASGAAASPYYQSCGGVDKVQRALMAFGWAVLALGSALGIAFAVL